MARLVTDNGLEKTLAPGGGHDTPEPWMAKLGLLELSPSTASAIGGYVAASKAAGADPPTRARGVLTLLLASLDFNLR